jgi:hypothetical protein
LTDSPSLPAARRTILRSGAVIPAHPLALDASRRLDERRQRALTRYYLAAGVGGLAVGVHTTQFRIRDAGLLEPVLGAAVDAIDDKECLIKVAGVVGPTRQAVAEAELAASLGYDLALISMGGLDDWSEDDMLDRAAQVGRVLPLFGFYLQPAVGGRELSYAFWRRWAEMPNLEAIKIAPFDRYRTSTVVRAICDSDRRDEIALYTGNDDAIVTDLLTPYRFRVGDRLVEKRIVGGLLGHWSFWTSRAVALLASIQAAEPDSYLELLALGSQTTDANGAVFDAEHAFLGCIPGINEVLHRQGLLSGSWCLDPDETLSVGQAEEITRVCRDYPHLGDDAFVRQHLDRWLA